jgi:hypothetical protein
MLLLHFHIAPAAAAPAPAPSARTASSVAAADPEGFNALASFAAVTLASVGTRASDNRESFPAAALLDVVPNARTASSDAAADPEGFNESASFANVTLESNGVPGVATVENATYRWTPATCAYAT